MTNQRFPLPPLGLPAKLLPLLLGGLLPLVLVGVVVLASGHRDGPQWMDILPALALLPVAGLLMAWVTHGRAVELHDGCVVVRRRPVPRAFELAALDLPAARVGDLQADASLRPLVKLIGTRLPGFRSGWFVTRNRQRAFVLATTSLRVAVLPLHDGRLLLLGVERPEALIAALRGEAGARASSR